MLFAHLGFLYFIILFALLFVCFHKHLCSIASLPSCIWSRAVLYSPLCSSVSIFNLACLSPAVAAESRGPSSRISSAHISPEFFSYFSRISPHFCGAALKTVSDHHSKKRFVRLFPLPIDHSIKINFSVAKLMSYRKIIDDLKLFRWKLHISWNTNLLKLKVL